MADNLIFPIGFDLQKAVDEASQDWDKKYAGKLEAILAKRPVKIKLDFENLTDVKTRLAQLKIEPITPETKNAIKELARELQVLAKALEQVQKYSGRSVGTAEVRGARIDEIEAKAAAARELARQRAIKAEQAEIKLAEARERSANAANRAATGVRNLTNAYKEQSTYLDRLIKRMVTYWSVQQVQTFLTNIREVTAQFELQRVSLGAIIQDQNRANQLFSEIKSFALKSPVSIMDLTKYTKQVAAYGIETEKLFDTTKMLTDVSVGLGVDLQRIVLFFGQVRARGALFSSEIRQATEAGIPLLELLAKKYSDLNDQMVTTAQVQKMVEKGMVGFDMVEQIFKDMTSAGGMFYNMQEKQGNTLFGLWAKLGDAASVMYDEIGNTESVNEGMKDAINLLTSLMRNWRLVGGEMIVVAATMGIISAKNKSHATATALQAAALNKVRAAGIAYNSILAQEAKLTTAATAAQRAIIAARKANAKAALDAAIAERTAANSTNVWTRSMSKLKEAFVGNWVTLLIAAIAGLGVAIYNAYEKANKLKNTLNSIDAEQITLTSQSVRNFEFLANAAVKAANGSKQQKDALDELHRTYKDMIPVQDLTIEKLRAMHGNYSALTIAIREYIAEQQKQKKLSAIQEQYGAEIQEQYKKLREYLTTGKEINVGSRRLRVPIKFELSETEYNRFFNEFEKQAEDATKPIAQKIKDSFEAIGFDLTPDQIKAIQKIGRWGEFDDASITKLNEALVGQAAAIKGVHEAAADGVGDLGRYSQELKRMSEEMDKNIYKGADGRILDDNSFLKQRMQSNEWIKKWTASIKTQFAEAGITIREEWFNTIDKINEADPSKISAIQFDAIIKAVGDRFPTLKNYLISLQEQYENIVPSNRTTQALRDKLNTISKSTGVSMDILQRHLINAGESWEAYSKRVRESIKDYENQVEEMHKANAAVANGNGVLKTYTDEEIKKTGEYAEALKLLLPFLQALTGRSGGGTRTSDPRLQILNDIANKMAQINKEYDDLLKKEGQTKALADTQKLFASSFADMQKVADKYKFKLPEFEVPQTIEDVQKWYDTIIKEINRLGIKNADKILIELGFKRDKSAIDKQQREIEAELKRLADRISRTRTAKEFYEKILSQTGDVELAANVSLALYGETGKDLFYNTVKQIQEIFKSNDTDVDLKINADLSNAIDIENERINYGQLAEIYEKYQNQIIEGNRETAQNIIKEGQKTAASNIATWEKELAKAKDYEQQRTDIINRETQRRADIINSHEYKPEEKEERLKLSQKKQDEDIAKVNFEEFTKSEDYVRIFENLDNVATSSLKHLRKELQKYINTSKDLSPENMKTLVKAMEDIDSEIGERNPFDTLVSSAKEYMESIKNIKIAKQELMEAEAEYKAQEPQLTADVETAKAEKKTADADVVAAEQQLLDIQNQMAVLRAQETVDTIALAALKEREIAADNALVAAKHRQNKAQTNVTNAVQKQANAQNKVNNAQKKLNNNTDNAKKSQNNFLKSINNAATKVGEVQSAMEALSPILGDLTKEGTDFGDAWIAVTQAMETFQAIMTVVIILQEAFNIATESNPWMAVAAAVLAVTAALAGFIGAQKVKKANKEIERQQELLDQLEYTYGRLEKAADKAFGADFVANQKQQRKILLAQAEAYQKQYQAELSKGKKADEEKLKEYQEKYRDTMDAIADMEGQVAERMLGTDLTSAARDFANAWLEAYKEFGNTADAMSEKFHEMIQNMIVESLLAKVMERALKPAFDMIDNMNEEDFYSESFWKEVMAKAEQGAKDADHGAGVVMKWIEKMGYDMREMGSEYSGIAKEVSSASSEEINQLSAFVNTALYYVSPIPTISENVALIRQLMERGTTSTLPDTTAAGWTDWEQQAMDNYKAIAANTAATVVECRRAANACEESVEKLGRIITSKGSVSGMNVFMKG